VDVDASLAEPATRLVAEWLSRVIDGSAPRVPQDPAEATSFPRRRPDDGVVEPGASVRSIYNMVRALVAPLPGARYHGNVIDRFCSLGEIAAMKFPSLVEPPAPIADRREANREIRFRDGTRISEIDPVARTAAIRGGAVVERFAREELGLMTLT
jgi:hypothetical protein